MFLLDSSVLLVFMLAILFDRFKGSDVFHPGLHDLTGLNSYNNFDDVMVLTGLMGSSF